MNSRSYGPTVNRPPGWMVRIGTSASNPASPSLRRSTATANGVA